MSQQINSNQQLILIAVLMAISVILMGCSTETTTTKEKKTIQR